VLYVCSIRYTPYAIQDDTRLKSSFAKQGKVMNILICVIWICLRRKASCGEFRISDFNHSGCFMQNKPNSRKARMNLNFYLTKDYENVRLRRRGKNKAKTNPTCRGVASGEAGSNPISQAGRKQ